MFGLYPSEVLETSPEDFVELIDTYKLIRQEQAQLMFCIADYIVLKTAQTEDQSQAKSNWSRANEIRQLFTGEKSQTTNNLGGEELTIDQILELQRSGKTFKEYIQSI